MSMLLSMVSICTILGVQITHITQIIVLWLGIPGSGVYIVSYKINLQSGYKITLQPADTPIRCMLVWGPGKQE